jgi:hypothetical protein
MSKPKILLQFDSDPHASVFDAVVAIDAGVDRLLQYGNLEPTQVRDLTHGAMFTRKDLHETAIFIGGSNVARGEELLAAVRKCFFGPMRVSVLLDANGANTTAAAAVIAAARHLNLADTTATVLAATGPVGQRVARLLAGQGATVKLASRSAGRAEEVCEVIRKKLPQAKLSALQTSHAAEIRAAVAGSQLIVAAGAAGVELLSTDQRAGADALKVAIDLNAVPPVGIAGIDAGDKANEHAGVICYGALGVGGTKMKIHRAAIQQLFTANNQILDAEEVFAIGQQLEAKS